MRWAALVALMFLVPTTSALIVDVNNMEQLGIGQVNDIAIVDETMFIAVGKEVIQKESGVEVARFQFDDEVITMDGEGDLLVVGTSKPIQWRLTGVTAPGGVKPDKAEGTIYTFTKAPDGWKFDGPVDSLNQPDANIARGMSVATNGNLVGILTGGDSFCPFGVPGSFYDRADIKIIEPRAEGTLLEQLLEQPEKQLRGLTTIGGNSLYVPVDGLVDIGPNALAFDGDTFAVGMLTNRVHDDATVVFDYDENTNYWMPSIGPSPPPGATKYFGQHIELDGDTLYVMDSLAGTIYEYERPAAVERDLAAQIYFEKRRIEDEFNIDDPTAERPSTPYTLQGEIARFTPFSGTGSSFQFEGDKIWISAPGDGHGSAILVVDGEESVRWTACGGSDFGLMIVPTRSFVSWYNEAGGYSGLALATDGCPVPPGWMYGEDAFHTESPTSPAQAVLGANSYSARDSDNDGIADMADNCPGIANRHQFDSDFNGIGDACDAHAHQPTSEKRAEIEAQLATADEVEIANNNAPEPSVTVAQDNVASDPGPRAPAIQEREYIEAEGATNSWFGLIIIGFLAAMAGVVAWTLKLRKD